MLYFILDYLIASTKISCAPLLPTFSIFFFLFCALVCTCSVSQLDVNCIWFVVRVFSFKWHLSCFKPAHFTSADAFTGEQITHSADITQGSWVFFLSVTLCTLSRLQSFICLIRRLTHSGSIRSGWLITLICITADSLQLVLTFLRVRDVT